MAETGRAAGGLMAGLRRMEAALAGRGAGQAALPGDPVGGPARLWRAAAFGAAARAETWQLLADVTEAGVSVEETFETLIAGFRRAGRTGRALVLAEMRAGLLDGNAGARLAPYVSAPERLLLDGLGSQQADAVFRGAARLMRNRMALRRATAEAVAMPVLLCFGLLALVLFFGLELLPALGEIVDFGTLPPLQDVTVRVTLALSADPLALAWGIAGAAAALAALMRLWTGPGRAFADRFPPFSLMRLQAGTGFLFAVIEHGRNGTAVTPRLLERMAKATGRYEASRIRALVPHMERTGNLGAAAMEAGQGFPDDALAPVLRTLWNRKDGIARAGVFLERRLERIEAGVKARMAVLNAALLTLVTAVLVLLMSVMMPVFDQLNRVTSGA